MADKKPWYQGNTLNYVVLGVAVVTLVIHAHTLMELFDQAAELDKGED